MAKKKADGSVTRDKLLRAMGNIPNSATLWTGHVINPDEDFTGGLCLNHSGRMDKGQVMAEINVSQFQTFPTIPEYDSHLLLNPRLYVWKDSINQSQRFPATPGAEHYTHVVDKCNSYYDIFFRLDRARKTITFALGNMKKEIPVVEGTEWCWKPTRKGILCQNIDRLEKNFLDPFWNPIAVDVGRKVLGIKPVI